MQNQKCSLHLIMWKISLKRWFLWYSLFVFVYEECVKIQGTLCCKENRRKGSKSTQIVLLQTLGFSAFLRLFYPRTEHSEAVGNAIGENRIFWRPGVLKKIKLSLYWCLKWAGLEDLQQYFSITNPLNQMLGIQIMLHRALGSLNTMVWLVGLSTGI